MSRSKLPNVLTPALALIALAGAAQSDPATKAPDPTAKEPSTATPTPSIPRRSPPYLLPDGSITFGPSRPTPSQQQMLEELARLRNAPVFPDGPGDIIPPCVIAYGWTTQGPTDQNGHLLRVAPHLPRWTDVQRDVPRAKTRRFNAGLREQKPRQG